MIDIDIVINITVFFIGMFFHKICSDLIGMGYIALFVRVVEIQTLKMLQIVDNDIEFVHKIKAELLKESNIPAEKARLITETDRKTLETWRESVILHFISAYPEKYRHNLEFTNWLGAMRQIKYVEQTQRKTKKFN